MSWAETVERARGGDIEARAKIVQDHEERIVRALTIMVGDCDVARDLAQDTFRRALERLDDLRLPERLTSWIYSIAMNLCRTHLRARAQQEPAQALEEDLIEARGSVLSSIVRRESAEAVAIAIDRLPILLREAFVLHVVEDQPYAEMAEALGCSAATLHVRAHRARALLRRQLGPVVDTIWSDKAPG